MPELHKMAVGDAKATPTTVETPSATVRSGTFKNICLSLTRSPLPSNMWRSFVSSWRLHTAIVRNVVATEI